jgi:hypothetical protein
MGRDPYFPPAALRLVSGERRARGTPEKIIGPAMFERLERSIENYAPAAHGREHVLLDRLAAVYDQRVADVKRPLPNTARGRHPRSLQPGPSFRLAPPRSLSPDPRQCRP